MTVIGAAREQYEKSTKKPRNNVLPKIQILKIRYRKQWQLVAEMTMISLLVG